MRHLFLLRASSPAFVTCCVHDNMLDYVILVLAAYIYILPLSSFPLSPFPLSPFPLSSFPLSFFPISPLPALLPLSFPSPPSPQELMRVVLGYSVCYSEDNSLQLQSMMKPILPVLLTRCADAQR